MRRLSDLKKNYEILSIDKLDENCFLRARFACRKRKLLKLKGEKIEGNCHIWSSGNLFSLCEYT